MSGASRMTRDSECLMGGSAPFCDEASFQYFWMSVVPFFEAIAADLTGVRGGVWVAVDMPNRQMVQYPLSHSSDSLYARINIKEIDRRALRFRG